MCDTRTCAAMAHVQQWQQWHMCAALSVHLSPIVRLGKRTYQGVHKF